MNGNMAYAEIPAVTNLNKVEGFDPSKFLRDSNNGKVLDLKFQKLWFRLAHPNGRIKSEPLKITEQMAIIEAKVYLAKEDAEPVETFMATGFTQNMGPLYITSAQYEAAANALSDAGFGIQFCDQNTETKPAAIVGQRQQASAPASASAKPNSAKLTVAPPPAAPRPAEKKMEQAQPKEKEPAPKPTAVHNPLPPLGTADKAEDVRLEEIAAAQPSPSATVENAAAVTEKTESPANEVPQAAPVEATDVPPADEAPPAQASADMEDAPDTGFTADMPVDAIMARMSLDEAKAIIVDVGTRTGMALGDVAENHPASLKWYVTGYDGDNNILRAGAKLLLEQPALQKAG